MHSLTSALHGGEWSSSRSGRFIAGEIAPGSHRIGGWVCLTAVLDALGKRKIPSPLEMKVINKNINYEMKVVRAFGKNA
jgi:hypothetical protein